MSTEAVTKHEHVEYSLFLTDKTNIRIRDGHEEKEELYENQSVFMNTLHSRIHT